MENEVMSRKTDTNRVDIYARITDRIVKDLEQGVRPWMKPWSDANTTGRISRPVRHNGLPYSGMNYFFCGRSRCRGASPRRCG